jgi:ABC-type uncharacterized transport system ATPase subunit
VTAPPIIQAQSLTKFYGRDVGVERLDFTVEQGEIFGFLGPNGLGRNPLHRIRKVRELLVRDRCWSSVDAGQR